MSFSGAKVALLNGDRVLTIQRDDIPSIPWPGHWDLPGGGREGRETPEACVLREVAEELGLLLPPERLLWRRCFASALDPGLLGWFFAGRIKSDELAQVRFGNEGQGWQMMPVAGFLAHPKAVGFLQDRLALCLREMG
ncbi:MAG: NUDIX hydrolase [Paracoccaceae bacterium]|nr:NUDIX hydrolase [Paracoccaceae bacterium]